MTREEQIEEAAEKYRDKIFDTNPNGFTTAPFVNEDSLCHAFERGAQWADEHPQHGINACEHKIHSLEQQLAIAEEALNKISEFGGVIGHPYTAKEALAKIEAIKSK